MSRYDDDCDGDYFPNQYALWQANLHRALKGKRGQQLLADLREALMALPGRRLIEGAMCTVNPEGRRSQVSRWGQEELNELVTEQGEGVCAVGAYLWHKQVKAGTDPAEAFDSLPLLLGCDQGDGIMDTALMAQRAGVAYVLAWDLAYRNDETFEGMTPEERWTAFVAWIDRELAEPAGAA